MKHSEETKRKISETLKRKGIKPPHHLSPCFKDGWTRKEVFGEQVAERMKEASIKANLGVKRSSATRQKQRAKKLGENHWNYIDGRSYLPYTMDFTDELKETIRKRDNYTCQNCGMTEEEHLIVHGQKLHIHHIDYIKENLSLIHI